MHADYHMAARSQSWARYVDGHLRLEGNPAREGVVAAAIVGLPGVGGGEVRGIGVPRDEGIARGRVHGNAFAVIDAAAAEVGGENQGAAVPTQPRHKGVRETTKI